MSEAHRNPSPAKPPAGPDDPPTCDEAAESAADAARIARAAADLATSAAKSAAASVAASAVVLQSPVGERATDAAVRAAETTLERAVAHVIAENSGQFPKSDRRTRRMGVNRAFRAVKAQHAADRSVIERVADRLTTIVSSSPFLLLHGIWFALWISWNTGLLGFEAFDPFPFGLLTMVVSLEAIFLSLFVLMAQNRESAIAELREEVTLQVNLRMEEEVTKTLQLVAGLYARLGHRLGEDDELRDMLQPLDALAIERELMEQIAESAQSERKRRAKKDAAAAAAAPPAATPPVAEPAPARRG